MESNLSYNTLLCTGKPDVCTSSSKSYNAFLEVKVKFNVCKC